MRPTLQITVDCTDPRVLVAFWATALGYVLEPPPAGATSWVSFWRSIGVPEDELPDDEDHTDSIVDPEGG